MSDSYTVDPITVTGTRLPGSGGLSGAAGFLGGILSGWGRGVPTGGTYRPATTAAQDNASVLNRYGINDFYGNGTPPAPVDTTPTVSPVDVIGQRPPSGLAAGAGSLVGALGPALSQALMAGGSNGPSNDTTTVDQLDVTGPRAQPPLTMPGIQTPPNPGALTSSLPGDFTPTPDTPAPSPTPDTPLDLKSLLTAGGLGLAGGLVAPAVGSLLTGTGAVTPPADNPSLIDQIKPYLPLIATGVPLALGGTGGGGPGGSISGDTASLASLADKSSALADRLGQVATAGMAGDIGGRGMNSISHMVQRAQAAIRQRYAAMGMSGSTAEGDDLNAAAQAGTDQQFKVGQDLAKTGLSAIAALTGQSASIYTNLLNAATAADTRLGNNLANFATALGNALGRVPTAPAAGG